MTNCPDCCKIMNEAFNYCTHCGAPLFFVKKHFIIQRSRKFRSTLEILDADMNPLFTARYRRYSVSPGFWTDVQANVVSVMLQGLAGSFLGEIHPLRPFSAISPREWRIYDAKDKFKGTVSQRSGAHRWALSNPEEYLIANIEEDSKRRGFNIVALDTKQIITSCSAMNGESYKIEILRPEIDSFLILSYVIICLIRSPFRL